MEEPRAVTWEQIVAERKPKFDELRQSNDREYLSPEQQSALEEHAFVLEAAYHLGADYVPSEQKAERRRLLETAKSYIPYTSSTNIWALSVHIDLCLALGDAGLGESYGIQGLQLLQTMVAVEPAAEQGLLSAMARLRESQGRNKEAADLYAAAIKAKPDDECVTHLIRQAGVAYLDAGLYVEGIPYLSSINRQDDYEWTFYQQLLAEAYERVGRWSEAIAVYLSLLKDTPLEERDLIEHLAFRKGFCEARRDTRRVRPTGAKRGSSGYVVLPSGDKEGGEGLLTEHEKTRLMVSRLEQRLLRLGQSRVIHREEPFQNVVHLRETLRSCEEYILWVDMHFRARALEDLAREANPARVKSIRILSGEDMIDDSHRRDWPKFKKEMAGKGIQVEWRTVDKKVSHDRYIIAGNVCYNVPPVGTLYEGSYGEILETSNRPPYEKWWSEANPLL